MTCILLLSYDMYPPPLTVKNLRVVVTVTNVSAENDLTRKKIKNCPHALIRPNCRIFDSTW
jgi:hypothetical protein